MVDHSQGGRAGKLAGEGRKDQDGEESYQLGLHFSLQEFIK
jgi:hypothetical protein